MTAIRRDAAELPAVTITVTCPDGSRVAASLGLSTLVVGTAPDCDVVVSDPHVSQHHVELRLVDEGIVLRDLGAKNGTYLGRTRVREVVLPPGEVVSIGSSRLSVDVVGAPSLVRLSPAARFGDALGGSVVMRALFARLELAAATHETVLLLGESGTGKELLAHALHEASPRADGPFVIVDCSSIAPNLIEAELFGYEKGAFTGAVAARQGLLEQAHGGTLFIDELGELPLDLQPKLLRAIESRQFRRLGSKDLRSFDARVLAATHRDLKTLVAKGTFRQDLFYRMSVLEVRVPPLREHKEDIPLLVERMLAAWVPPRDLEDLPAHAMQLLMDHDWPGNVRELRNTVARLVVFSEIGEPAPPPPAAQGSAPTALYALPLREARDIAIEQFEKSYVESRLREHQGNVARAATSMGVSRQFAYRLIARYGLRKDEG